jgi:DNA-binding protein HU-beta
MTKANLVEKISKSTGINRKTVSAVIEGFIENIEGSLSEDENVYLRGFGSFVVKQRAAKTARNIKKNTTVIIPARKVPAFKPSKAFTIEKEI